MGSALKPITLLEDARQTMPIIAEPHITTNMDKSAHQPKIICLSCPLCKACEVSSHPAFQLEDLDKKCRCHKCGKPSRAMHWLCKCQTPWHLCQIHKYCYYDNKNLSRDKPCKRAKTISMMTHDELVAHDNKRARREPHTILPPQANILSPGLRERFARLLQR